MSSGDRYPGPAAVPAPPVQPADLHSSAGFSHPAQLRRCFRTVLNGAIAQGLPPDGGSGLGPRTVLAIATVAREHPEAAPELITAAVEIFAREHHPSAI